MSASLGPFSIDSGLVPADFLGAGISLRPGNSAALKNDSWGGFEPAYLAGKLRGLTHPSGASFLPRGVFSNSCSNDRAHPFPHLRGRRHG
jgi:hypothetical protein